MRLIGVGCRACLVVGVDRCLLLWAAKCQVGDDGNVTKRRNGDNKHKVLLWGAVLGFVCWVVVGNRCWGLSRVREVAYHVDQQTRQTQQTQQTQQTHQLEQTRQTRQTQQTHNSTSGTVQPPYPPTTVRLRTPVQDKTAARPE